MDGAASPFRAPVIALDGPDKVTGAARYTFDVSLPGMLHAKVLRSPYPHARIRSIDTGRAEALPGVVAIVTGAARGLGRAVAERLHERQCGHAGVDLHV